LTALGLAVGVGLVIVVNALSSGLDAAQATVLQPLTGVGTDMTVTRPLKLSATGGNPFASLSPAERAQLRSENGGSRLGFRSLAKPGKHFSVDRFRISTQLTFPASKVTRISGLSSVQGAAGALTLTDTHISGTMPKVSQQQTQPGAGATGGGFGGPPGGGGFGGAPGGAPGGGGFSGPNGINLTSMSVTGVDGSKPALGAVTPGQVIGGRYFSKSGDAYGAILSDSYAKSQNLTVGKTFTLGGKTFHVIGVASSPLGGSASDVYVELATLQKVAGFAGRVNTVQVRAQTVSAVSTVQSEISRTLSGAQVTTAKALANRVGGSLKDAQSLSNTLGLALELVGLLAAILIAILLTLSSVTKRTREIGTLKAIGWSQTLVVRQIGLEALVQGLVGGVLGAVIGVAGAGVLGALGIKLTASVAAPAQQTGPFGFGRFAQSTLTTGSSAVHLTAPVSPGLILAAIGLATLAGLIAGAVGGLRASRLRPALALRALE
jgi:putative ABC transport system permease protein